MAPALLPGDWLLLDPTGQRWPRPGSIVVIREPWTGILAIKRVAARGRHAADAAPPADPGIDRRISPGDGPRLGWNTWLISVTPATDRDDAVLGSRLIA